jgi:hypothetical protein
MEKMLAEHPHVVQHFVDLNDDKGKIDRSRARVAITREYGEEIADRLLPKRKPGRASYEGNFALLSAPARKAIVDKLGVEQLEGLNWTPELTGAAADALVAKFANPTSAAMALKNLRHGLMGLLGIDPKNAKTDPRTGATYREEVTTAHNARAAPRLEARARAGIVVPPPYERIGEIVARARAFVAAPAATPQAAADLLVILSARPGEAELLKVGDRGAISGMLKKKPDDENKYNLISVVGLQLAQQYLEAWRALPAGPKRTAMSGLSLLTATWGLQRRDLRAVGAALAVRAEALEGNAGNVGQARAIHAQALRHAPGRARAQEHYERVNDPMAQLCASLGELSVEDLAAVRALVAARAARAR